MVDASPSLPLPLTHLSCALTRSLTRPHPMTHERALAHLQPMQGALLTSGYSYLYALALIPAGLLADKYNRWVCGALAALLADHPLSVGAARASLSLTGLLACMSVLLEPRSAGQACSHAQPGGVPSGRAASMDACGG